MRLFGVLKRKLSKISETSFALPGLLLVSAGLASLMTLAFGMPDFQRLVDFSNPTGLDDIAVGPVQQPSLNGEANKKASNPKKPNKGDTIYLGVITDPAERKVIQRAYVSTPPYATTTCDQGAANRAYQTWQADSANEQAYHETQLNLIKQLPDEDEKAKAIAAEDERHQQRQAEIDRNYNQELAAANCTN